MLCWLLLLTVNMLSRLDWMAFVPWDWQGIQVCPLCHPKDSMAEAVNGPPGNASFKKQGRTQAITFTATLEVLPPLIFGQYLRKIIWVRTPGFQQRAEIHFEDEHQKWEIVWGQPSVMPLLWLWSLSAFWKLQQHLNNCRLESEVLGDLAEEGIKAVCNIPDLWLTQTSCVLQPGPALRMFLW